MRTYRLGTRGSKLALWQAEHVAAQLMAAHPGARFDIVPIHTVADKRQDVPLQQIGDKSLFIREIEAALLEETVDLAVHSLKDVPSRLDEQFTIAAVLAREDARDVLLTATGGGLGAVAAGARIGTSSLRREAQLRALRAAIEIVPIRGNVDTRLKKLQAGEYDGIVLAAAGLIRLGVPIPAQAFLDPASIVPAPGQAAICVEILARKRDLAELMAAIDHASTRSAVEAERSFAAELDAGCRVPVAAYASFPPGSAPGASNVSSELTLHGVVAAVDGSRTISVHGSGNSPAELGKRLGRDALQQGAAELLQAQ